MARERTVDITKADELTLGSRIRLRRQYKKIRLSKMAEDIGYHKAHLSRVENNRVAPSDEFVKKIADYLEVTLNDLKEAPIAQLAPANEQRKPVRRPGFILGAPPMVAEHNGNDYEKQKRTIGERIERVIKMAHLSEAEEGIIEERLVAIASELLKLIKDTRQID